MNNRKLTALAAAATMALAGTAVGTAQARHGADDPAGHQRKGADDAQPHFRHGADDPAGDQRRGRGADDAQPHAKRAHHKHHRRHRGGADDGPNHR